MTDAAGYREWGVAPELARHVVCTWAGQFGQQGEQYTDRVFPDGCIDIVWTDGGLILAGPDTAAVPLEWRPGAWFAGIRFRPGLAPAVLGVPASAVLDTRVELGDVMGDRARALDDHLRRAPSLRAAAGALVAAVRGWLPAAAPADRLVEAANASCTGGSWPRSATGRSCCTGSCGCGGFSGWRPGTRDATERYIAAKLRCREVAFEATSPRSRRRPATRTTRTWFATARSSPACLPHA